MRVYTFKFDDEQHAKQILSSFVIDGEWEHNVIPDQKIIVQRAQYENQPTNDNPINIVQTREELTAVGYFVSVVTDIPEDHLPPRFIPDDPWWIIEPMPMGVQ